jgi:hypothetical protein
MPDYDIWHWNKGGVKASTGWDVTLDADPGGGGGSTGSCILLVAFDDDGDYARLATLGTSGRTLGRRTYNGPGDGATINGAPSGIPTSFANSAAGSDASKGYANAYLSIRFHVPNANAGLLDNAAGTFAASCPPGTRVGLWPEADRLAASAGKQFAYNATGAQFASAVHRIADKMHAANSRILLGPNFTGELYRTASGDRTAAAWLPSTGTDAWWRWADFGSVDTYCLNGTDPLSKIVQKAFDYYTTTNTSGRTITLAVWETGIKTPSYPDKVNSAYTTPWNSLTLAQKQRRANWIDAGFTWLNSAATQAAYPVTECCYWNGAQSYYRVLTPRDEGKETTYNDTYAVAVLDKWNRVSKGLPPL